MNWRAAYTIFANEMARTRRTLMQSVLAPVISTSLYFIVFGAAIGTRIEEIDGVRYGAFIVPGLVMMMLLMQAISNAAISIYFPKFTGTIYEVLTAPISTLEILVGYVGASAAKTIVLGVIILITANLFVPLEIDHPIWMASFLVLISVTFSLFGFIVGIWADSFEKLNLIPMMIVTPLTFLGGSFYSISVLPDPWQTISLLNPVVYLISGFRWSFYSVSDVHIGISVAMTLVFLAACIAVIAWIFRTGWRLRT